MSNTLFRDFDQIFEHCFTLFRDKNADYGPTWLLYRYTSLNDEIWRKAKRIRTLEEHRDAALIPEGRDVEYIGIINYCIMFLIKLDENSGLPDDEMLTREPYVLDSVNSELLYTAYRQKVAAIRDLLVRKNTDYGDAWRSMGIESMTDQVIIRTYRIRQILKNNGSCKVSEGVEAQLNDIINYCIFALIKMDADVLQP